jgi:hypothetical protein
MDPIKDLDSYVVTDGFFGRPFVDIDEWREDLSPHRYVHGGFEGTDTRFAFYLPPPERYSGRLYQPLEGANAGHENVQTGPLGVARGSFEVAFRLGGYMVESNMGHIGDVMDPKAGPDPTIYGWRAAAETARFSKFVAAQVLGTAPRYAYVYGGSGGARRSPLCLAYAPDVWDAALPFMGDARDGEYGDFRLLRGASQNFACMFNVQRVLGAKLADVVDAMQPGGSGDPFAGLDTHQREELANLYRLGYPRGDEWVIGQPSGTIWLWASMAERLVAEDADYFEAFWTQPGYVGHDSPQLVAADVIDTTVAVRRTLTGQDFLDDPRFQTSDYSRIRASAITLAGTRGFDLPIAVEIDDVSGYKLGAGVRPVIGKAAGRQLYCTYHAGDVLLCDGAGEASNLRFTDVLPGDEVHLDNRPFLAYCYFYRHHLLDSDEWQFLQVDGRPVYAQHEQPEMSPFMATVHTARYDGKLLWVHHTHDASLWPPQGLGFKSNVERLYGVEEGAKRFRLRWTENAEHVPVAFVPSQPNRASNTWLIDYWPIIEQSLVDLSRWVEEGVEPVGTTFDFAAGKVTLPPTAAERGGIQPVVHVLANGGRRAEVGVGEVVSVEVHAETPPGGGAIVSAEWDFDGSGTYPFSHTEVDGTATKVALSTTHAWDRPGTYFATCLVHSNVDGDVNAISRRLPNLASARIVVS